MSSHVLDVSGARPLTTTTNDPAATKVWMPAKAGEDVTATLSGFRELRLALPENARIQRRQYVRRTTRKENGRPVKDDAGEFVYDEVLYEQLILVVASATLFGRTSALPEDAAPEGPTQEPQSYEGHPSTSIVAKRSTDLHFLESGELLEELELRELVPTPADEK